MSSNIFPSASWSLPTLSSSDETSSLSQFSHSTPLQLPHAETHYRPCRLQLQTLVLQGLFLVTLQLHRMKRRMLSGAALKSVIIGS